MYLLSFKHNINNPIFQLGRAPRIGEYVEYGDFMYKVDLIINCRSGIFSIPHVILEMR